MKNFAKKISLFSMFTLSSVFAYISYSVNRTGETASLPDIFGNSLAEGASCGTVISCTNGSGSGTGSSTASGSGSSTASGSGSGTSSWG